jgi:hypothetical protein
MTSSERVGSLFLLNLSLQIKSIRDVVGKGHERQRQKYLHFPPKSKKQPAKSNDEDSVDAEKGTGSAADYPFYYEGHFNTMEDATIMHTLEHLKRHGFNLEQLSSLDNLQINQLMSTCHQLFTHTKRDTSYPQNDIAGHYTALGPTVNFIPSGITTKVKKAMGKNAHVLNKGKSRDYIPNVTPKHYREKPKTKGEGNTSAVLSDVSSLAIFLEFAECYHSHCKYSSSLPPDLRDSFDIVEYGGRNLIRYFEKMIYRGDNSVDARTTKVHAQMRTGQNYKSQRNVQHSTCATGERLLKTEAKGISGTAQQRGHETFEKQTCLRIGDRLIMDNFQRCLEEMQESAAFLLAVAEQDLVVGAEQKPKGDRFSRQQPHFHLSREGKKVQASDRKGNLRDPDKQSGMLPDLVVKYLLTEDPNIDHYEVYSEIIIRDDSYIRAWPNYRTTGAWYDFVSVQWELGIFFPARVLCFYNKTEEDGEQKPYALVHVVDEASKGKVKNTIDSLLTTHFRMAYSSKFNRRLTSVPTIRSVPVESIDSCLMGYLHKPSKLLFNSASKEVMIVTQRSEWAYHWLAFNEEMMKATKVVRGKTVYVSLGNKEFISKVRANAKQKLEIPIELNN